MLKNKSWWREVGAGSLCVAQQTRKGTAAAAKAAECSAAAGAKSGLRGAGSQAIAGTMAGEATVYSSRCCLNATLFADVEWCGCAPGAPRSSPDGCGRATLEGGCEDTRRCRYWSQAYNGCTWFSQFEILLAWTSHRDPLVLQVLFRKLRYSGITLVRRAWTPTLEICETRSESYCDG